ncbi:hypothetical protein HUG15_07540 [Salicibibacter cibarius]|uniref:Uncharacterized protein n=1 Tax=Salicibibacter cibarius TaxID=2743000 RepID=A0A7T6Z1V3_9BACI|nr:hypothetical protein [Salicibibacter cibarius]QQK75448.1 hypothetical protein HUG15_07540 [Salicibibacter cibarius]
MNESGSDEKDNFTFFKNSIIRPNINIENNIHLSVMNNIALLLFLFIVTLPILYIAYIPIFLTSTGFEEYASMGILFVFVGLFVYLLLIPIMLINICVIYLLNKKFSDVVRPFKKVLSDHTAIWISTFLLYSIGLYFYSYMETFRPYITLAGTLIMLVSIIMYVRRLILLVKHYVKDGSKKVVNIYAIILVLTALFGLPFFLSNVFEGVFIEQPMVNIWMLLEDLGFI